MKCEMANGKPLRFSKPERFSVGWLGQFMQHSSPEIPRLVNLNLCICYLNFVIYNLLFKHPTSGIRHPASGIRHPAPDIFFSCWFKPYLFVNYSSKEPKPSKDAIIWKEVFIVSISSSKFTFFPPKNNWFISIWLWHFFYKNDNLFVWLL